VVGAKTDDEHDRALDGQIDGQGDESAPDEPYRPSLPVVCDIGQFPEHDGGRPDLDQTVQAEAGESDGS